ncbi:cytochrome P450 family protein [Dictyostelium discoideum AX4]|uniref:Probable cytochrome P450 518B1 n=1 Tax=Dictyostelium discoideum TaxID=44689 RepID=C518B_DICDI|nr:cytochrome P450 family protein [Dictyostelium discoideum AX4]Q1ZXL2.1 RecName: Full=Probable cytochrome P450 518B1 [Dictyostelium discoideum]EAS66914.1 cytochrome P450 family protein [Dictyostelium discoideum AX4]|eukprot:XP_001134598.1 cytochrome P450 family protein [Dictyostelium discoideum AX4]
MLTNIIILIILYLFYDFCYKNFKYRNYGSPWALPVIGHFIHVINQPHLVVHNDRMKYNNGRFVNYWFGDYLSIAITDPILYKKIYLNFPKQINSRLKSPTVLNISERFRGIISSNENNWDFHHGILSKLFNGHKAKINNFLFEKETKFIIEYMKKISKSGENFDTRSNFLYFYSNILFDYILGKRVENIYENELRKDRKKFMVSIQEVMDSVGLIKFLNYLILSYPFLSIYLRYFTYTTFNLKKILKQYYDEHLETIDLNKPRDVLDNLIMEYKNQNAIECDKSFVAIAIELLAAGTDTNSSTSEWFLTYLVNNPIYQDKIYDELIGALKINKPLKGSDVLINLSHRPLTPLFNATLKEVLRLIPATPFSVPRMSNEGFEVDGIKIPKGTYLFPSMYSIFRDEKYWGENANKFYPERFLTDSHSNNYFPYGVGKRMCLGSNFSQHELYICLTNIVLNFKIKSIDGKPLNEIPNYGITFRPNIFEVKLENR